MTQLWVYLPTTIGRSVVVVVGTNSALEEILKVVVMVATVVVGQSRPVAKHQHPFGQICNT